MKTNIPPKATLLLVDDIPANVSVLFDFLIEEGFRVLVSRDGKQAIQTAHTILPNLILLDVMMPGMDGFEVCEHLKSHEETKDIPIIFMTALTDVVDKVKGFQLGAADYITKPIQQEEVLARVTTHLRLCHLQKELQSNVGELQLQKTELEKRNQELDAFARTVAHDLKNPLTGIIGLTDSVVTACSSVETVNPKALERIRIVKQAGQKMLTIIEELLLFAGVSKQRDVPLEPLDMKSIVEQILHNRLNYMIENTQATISLPDTWPVAIGYAPWVEEVWANYISNGIKYGGKPPILQLGARKEENRVRFWVKDNGMGISHEAQKRLFTPFTRLHEEHAEGHGLGLSIVQQIVEKLNGQVGVESEVNTGSLFYFVLPTI